MDNRHIVKAVLKSASNNTEAWGRENTSLPNTTNAMLLVDPGVYKSLIERVEILEETVRVMMRYL